MHSRSNSRVLCGVLLLTLLAVQPVTAAPSDGTEPCGWIDAVEAWWMHLVDRLGVGGQEGRSGIAAVSEGQAGTTVDSGGGDAGAPSGDGGPEIDPGGGSTPAQAEGEGGPEIDPGG